MIANTLPNLKKRLAKNYKKQIYMSIEAAIVGLIAFRFGYKTALHAKGALPFFGGIWCMANALIVLFAFIDSTLSSAKHRFICTVIGCFVALLLCISIGPSYFAMFFGVALTVLASHVFGFEKGARVSSCVAAVIIGIGILAPTYNPFMNTLLRFIESSFGILFALMAVYLSYALKVREYTKPKKAKPKKPT